MIISDTDTDNADSLNRNLLRLVGPYMVKGTALCIQCGEPVTTVPTLVLFGQGVTGLADAESIFIYLHLECASELAQSIRTQTAQILGDNRRRHRTRYRPVTQQWLRELEREAHWQQWLVEATTPEERETIEQCIQRERLAHEKFHALGSTAS